MDFVTRVLGYFGRKESSPAEQYAVGCETCGALRQTISIQQDTIDMLKGMLADEKSHRMALQYPQAPQSASDKPEPHPVRLSRVPWARRQATLEMNSQRQANELWRARAERAAKADAPAEAIQKAD